MIKIFAKHNTTEKALIICSRDHVPDIIKSLNEKYGGNWLLVDKLLPQGEILKFDDGLKYQGFHGRDERYVNGIEILI